MTIQAIFDRAYKHFIIEKNPRSFLASGNHGEGMCLYRGPNGSKCAIGLSISDEEYKTEMENRSVSTLQVEYGLFKGLDYCVLSELQGLHDSAEKTNNKEVWDEFAKENDLNIPC